MGTKKLKIKETLHYRRGYTHASCGECDYFVARHPCQGIGGVDLGEQPRCRIIGLNPGRGYTIHPKNICNKYDNREGLKRLINWRS